MESQLQELTIHESSNDDCDKEDERWVQLFYEMCNTDDELCEGAEDEEEEVGWGWRWVDVDREQHVLGFGYSASTELHSLYGRRRNSSYFGGYHCVIFEPDSISHTATRGITLVKL